MNIHDIGSHKYAGDLSFNETFYWNFLLLSHWLDTCTNAEWDNVVYHLCLVEENRGQMLREGSVCFLPLVLTVKTLSSARRPGGEGLADVQPHKMEDLIGWFPKELTDSGLDKLSSEDAVIAAHLLSNPWQQQELIEKVVACDSLRFRLHLDSTLKFKGNCRKWQNKGQDCVSSNSLPWSAQPTQRTIQILFIVNYKE